MTFEPKLAQNCTDEVWNAKTCMSTDCTIMPLDFGVVEHSCGAE